MDETVLKTLAMDFKLEALRKGIKLTFPTIGRSMLPLIRHNDRIEVVECDRRKLRTGDLIIFKGAGGSAAKIIAHRLVKKIKKQTGYVLITKGDSALSYDRGVSENNLIGKIIKIRKRNFCISLDDIFGRILNLIMFFLSVSSILPSGIFILRKAKRLFKRNIVKAQAA